MVRHCEAAGNHERIFQGSTDCDITDIGKKQLELLKKRFAGISVDSIYTSPLIRARKTAEALRGNRDIEIVSLPELTELHGGIIEGKPFFESFKKMPALAEVWDNHPQDFAPEGGEPMRNAYDRIWRAVLSIARENVGKTAVIVSHGGVIRCLNCRLLYKTIDRLKDTPWCENTGVTLFRLDGDMNPQVEFMNDTSHLPEELLPDRSRMTEVAKK